ncbi:UPF0759 protein YunF [Virgibacillus pantothenticus]|uniref:DUF72 domain-containing protein n=1 Tax=Virgibacillus pantothenticus TaxID=1473 RepID=A0A0L0QUY8_VIRPA|nr:MULTISPECIES: DUF72 domain-containing protein [Virgibacillus]API92623.1 hypothetical protein BKP57_12915 [Virgibacillus sp. 6R]KNE22399.1 hypothetical protein AFK71_01915 [Virgibacillus pantothenticus]MBS7428114.1 DUF72 domain-containing protein [Virgibacillus sp. 19R1-5]MBU8565375.1 DUF72 domain-containing protein [Virgibacillus pantothenticus]MBU8599406.1 DUF72 domain-containing protein [Virgibacillus pantothenticus]
MIYIGLTGWGDHYSLYPEQMKAKDKLAEYSSHFLVVEVDASFYAIQPIRNVEKWVKETPANFQFVVKAYQGMTGHQRTEEERPFASKKEMFEAFIASLQPYQDVNKLAMVLFQFPPWFDCTKQNVMYLRYCKQMMGGIPVALEFRNQSWFSERFREETLSFMKEEGWIHSIVDEPQAGEGSIPTVPVVTDEEKTLLRFHGRNVIGWNKPNSAETNWRDVRYLYKYNEEELLKWKTILQELEKETKDIIVLFNNNSGGDAAGNAKQLQKLLGIEYKGLAPKQLGLF